MAKVKEQPSIRSCIKQIFQDHPHLLNETSLASVVELFRKNYPNMDIEDGKLKPNIANVKSGLKGKKGGGKGGRRGRRKKVVEANGTPMAAASVDTSLERLEAKITDCLTIARGYGRNKLATEIKCLRRALAGVMIALDNE